MTVVVLHEKCEMGKADDKKLPSDSFLVSYKVEDELVAKEDIIDVTNPGQLLAKKGELVKLSYWKNEESRWMERDPLLVTAYAILALEVGLSIE